MIRTIHSYSRGLWRRAVPAALGCLTLCLTGAQGASLVAYWDFNDASDPTKTVDKVFRIEGALQGGAAFTPDAGGRTGAAGDRAMDFGFDSAGQIVRVADAAFLNFAASDDQITISFWQLLYNVANSSAFWGGSPSSGGTDRGIQAHTPWSDNNIYFDTSGCCDGGTQRINANVLTWDPAFDFFQWHHFAFVKNGPLKQIWIDGRKFLEGQNTLRLPQDFNQLVIGGDVNGGNSLQGLEDDFAVFKGALDEATIMLLASGTAPNQLPGVPVQTDPLIGGVIGAPNGFRLALVDSPTAAVDPASVKVKFDGADVTAEVTKSGNSTTVSYTSTGPLLPPGSTHEVAIEFKDMGGASFSAVRSFTVGNFTVLPASAALPAGAVDTSKPGFIWKVHQNDALQANDNQRPLDQLAGRLIDPNSGLPYDNFADPTFQGVALAPADPPNPTWAPITFEIPTVINLSQNEGDNNGAFTPDQAMPGIPFDLNGIAAQIDTYLELPQGLITMGVNSDDGFRTTAGQVDDAFGALRLGEFEGGRGAADTLFTIYVEQAGIYRFRTVWEEGGGGANIEWFTLKADGSKVLVNDVANGGVPAYRAANLARNPFIGRVLPPPGPRQQNQVSKSLVIELVDGDTAVADNSIRLKVDGEDVTLTKTRDGNTVTVTYTPSGLQIPGELHSAELSFSNAGGTFTRNQAWQFMNLKNLVGLENPVATENFDSAPEGGQPTGWTAINFTTDCSPDVDIFDPTDQTSDTYKNWAVVSTLNMPSLDGGSLNVAPGQTFNGQPVDVLAEGNVLYAESDGRCSDQVQFITSAPFNLSAATEGVVLVINVMYTQNQDSIGAIEYSVDGGNSWLPVVYYLDTPDIRLRPDGTVDAVATMTAVNADTAAWTDNGVPKGDKYGDALLAPITSALDPFIAPRINDNQTEGHRVEIFRLPQATGKSDVRLRFAQLGTDSWWFAVDNIRFYNVAGPVQPQESRFTSIRIEGAEIVFEWTGAGTLQSSTDLKTWTDVPGATSPRRVTIQAGAHVFYRIRS